MSDMHHPTARAVIAEIVGALRERAAGRRSQMFECARTGGNLDALAAKESECEAMADFVAAYARFYPDQGEDQP